MRYLDVFMRIPEIRNEGIHVPSQAYRQNFDQVTNALQKLAESFLHDMLSNPYTTQNLQPEEMVAQSLELAEEFMKQKIEYLDGAITEFEAEMKEREPRIVVAQSVQ